MSMALTLTLIAVGLSSLVKKTEFQDLKRHPSKMALKK
jgi:hypothetical protein